MENTDMKEPKLVMVCLVDAETRCEYIGVGLQYGEIMEQYKYMYFDLCGHLIHLFEEDTFIDDLKNNVIEFVSGRLIVSKANA
jgi:hypothetical protein